LKTHQESNSLPEDWTPKSIEEEKELKVSIRLSELEKSLELVLKGKCPTCGKEYKDDPERIKSEIKELKQVLNEVKKSIKDRKSKIEEYNEASRNNGLISQKKSLLEKILKEKESELIEVNSKIENLSGEFFGDKKKSLGEIISSFDEDKYLEVVKQIDVWEERQKEIQRATEFNKKIEKEELEIKDRIETKTKEKENVAYKKAILDKSKSLLDKEFSSYLLEKGLDAVENNLNDFFFRTYSKYSIYLKRDKKSVEFFYSPDKGNILSAVGTASGFEKQLLAIAFRIALSNLHNLGFLILDEIDESAENSNSIELYKNIMEMEFNQLFIVTHKESTIDFLLNDYKAKIFNFYEGEITIEN
jgi:DNA repair exonuclease SbcCD ATPase subunit